ncbi:MAG: GNAT family N-acetyltransferase [Alphaproteobacteria bacterium]
MATPADQDDSGVTVREMRADDEAGILDLFRRVFAVERAPAHWRWKFLANPAGREVVVAVDRDGRIVGQFASLPARGRIDGRPAPISQLLDHMVEPALRRHGVYAAMARAFHERHVAPSPGGAWYGFNLEEIHRIQRDLYDMTPLAPVEAWSRPVGTGAEAVRGVGARLADALVHVERVRRCPAGTDDLWETARNGYGVAIDRDARYLDWRYADCPDVEYALLAARHRPTRKLVGLLVVRPGWLHEPMAALVDWVVPPSAWANAAWRSLLAAADRVAREAGLPVLRAWLPPTSPDRDALVRRGFARGESPFLTSAWDDGAPGRPVDALRRGWHYTMGDTDVF